MVLCELICYNLTSLHFEVFKDKEYIDPFSVLDLSYIKYQSLPSKYRDKYYLDFKTKNWYNYEQMSSNSKLFKIEWENEIERQKYLIEHYAVWWFSNWQMWIGWSTRLKYRSTNGYD